MDAQHYLKILPDIRRLHLPQRESYATRNDVRLSLLQRQSFQHIEGTDTIGRLIDRNAFCDEEEFKLRHHAARFRKFMVTERSWSGFSSDPMVVSTKISSAP